MTAKEKSEGAGDGGGGGGMTKEEEEARLQLLYTPQDIEDTRCGLGPCTPSWLQVSGGGRRMKELRGRESGK